MADYNVKESREDLANLTYGPVKEALAPDIFDAFVIING